VISANFICIDPFIVLLVFRPSLSKKCRPFLFLLKSNFRNDSSSYSNGELPMPSGWGDGNARAGRRRRKARQTARRSTTLARQTTPTTTPFLPAKHFFAPRDSNARIAEFTERFNEHLNSL